MKSSKSLKAPITKPLLKELMNRQKADLNKQTQTPTVGSKPTDPAALYQDPGSGYNSDFIFPQD